MTSPRDRFARYRELMAARGFRPSRARGQNFLLDPTLHRAIAEAAELGPDALALEIGTGLGFLTRELATRAADVVSVELDGRLADIVAEELGDWDGGERVRLVRSDALDGEAFAAPVVAAVAELARGRAAKVVANLPYSVAGRMLAVAVTQPAIRIDRIVAVVQLELAERLAAAPGGRDYGGLTALVGTWGSVEVVRRIGREVFRPRPRVDSALVRIRASGAAIPEGFAGFVRSMFHARRKTLRHAIRALRADAPAAVLERWGACRAEQLGSAELLALFAELGPEPGTAGP